MKVLLLQNVAKLGQKGEVKEVSQGYASNFLFPNKKAKFVSPAEIRKIESQNNLINKKEQEVQQKAKSILNKLRGQKITVKEKANEKGHLFSQVHLKEIADAISEQLKIDISEDWINLNDPIKEIGVFDLKLEAYGDKSTIKLYVEDLKK